MTSQLAVDYGAGLSNAWSSVATFVPKLVAFLVILVIGWIIAKILAKIVTTVLAKVGFNRLAERSGLQQVLAKSDYDAPSLLAKVVYYAILLITLQLAIGVFGPNPVSDLLSRFVAWLPKLFIAILIIVIVAAVAKAVKDLVGGALGSASYGPVLATIASLFIWGAGIIAALNQIGVATAVTTPVLVAVLATVGGVIVVGVGGGLVRPMQDRWAKWLDKAEEEIPARRAERELAQQSTARHGQAAPAERASQAAPPQAPQAPAPSQAPTVGTQYPPQPQAPQHESYGGEQFPGQGGQPPTGGIPTQPPGQQQFGQQQFGGRPPQHGGAGYPPQGPWQPGPDPSNPGNQGLQGPQYPPRGNQ
ncbi:hypothetical protein [Tsukamurella sp. 1534]|uniref:mechanosensitive ion channel family protein n=1 Tax=Tsukamurella sp. 1534 TaxID=1151061 RepID=UPI0002FB4A08|nr:hypothetical protein [Tsukamurella sp. 1534]